MYVMKDGLEIFDNVTMEWIDNKSDIHKVKNCVFPGIIKDKDCLVKCHVI